MAKKIGVIIDFLTDEYAKKINEAAASHGYEVEYFDSSRAAVGNVDDCEIIYGHPSQKVIASAKISSGLPAAGQVWTASAGTSSIRIPTACSPTPPALTAPRSPSISRWSR